MNCNQLALELRIIKNRYSLFTNQGYYLRNCWVDSTVITGHSYYRLWQWKDGKSQCLRTLKPDEVQTIKDAIWRGKHIEYLENEIARLQAELQKNGVENNQNNFLISPLAKAQRILN